MEMQNQRVVMPYSGASHNTVRSAGIELFRVVLMAGICFLHAIEASEFSGGWLSYLLRPCVVGFVFISGWFGISFQLSKLIRLYSVGFICCIISVALTVWKFKNHPLLDGGFCSGVLWMWTKSLWFLHAYTVLMLLSSMINVALDSLLNVCDRRKLAAMLLPVILLVFGWAFLASMPLVRKVIPHSAGVLDYSGLTLTGIYIAGRIFRLLNLERFMHGRRLFVSVLIILIGPLRGGNYASPFSLLFAIILFCWFKDLHISSRTINRAILGIAPSMFSIYLLHGHKYGKLWMCVMNDEFLSYGIPIGISLIGTTLMVFFSCLCVGFLRKILSYPFQRYFSSTLELADRIYDKFIWKISNLL